MKHVKINSLWYRLAEDAEGGHYQLALQPLRPPNAQIVQGETGKFQIRPDVLLWSWTNWAGGENQIKVDTQATDRSYVLQNVEPFQKPGTLGIGYLAEQVNNSAGTAWATANASLFLAHDTLYACVGTSLYPWDSGNDRFGAAETMTGVAAVDPNSMIGDSDYLFVHDDGTDQIYRRTSGGTWSLHNDQCTLTGEVVMTELGPYIYIWVPATGAVYEVLKATANTATPEVPILYTNINSNVDADRSYLVAGDNRIYVASHDRRKTSIYEIIPSSAAGTGFGSELSTIYGLFPEAIFYAGGTIFLIGHDRTPDGTTASDRQVFYIDPEGSYGTLGSVRGFTDTNGPSALWAQPAGGRLATSAFALPATWASEDSDSVRMNLFEIDQVTGGIACVGGDDALLSATEQAISLVYYEGAYYMSNASTIIRWDTNAASTESGYAISPANDFGLSGIKVLDSVEVNFDPLPAGGAVYVGYQLDDASWVDTLVSSTDGDIGGKLSISTDTSTKSFRSLKLRVRLVGNVRVLNVDAYARVNRRIRVWDLMLDASDDSAPQGYNGAQIIANITAVPDNTVVDFVDNYLTHDQEAAQTALDVVIDSAVVIASQEGEGIIQVRLLEVF